MLNLIVLKKFINPILDKLKKNGCKIFADSKTRKYYLQDISKIKKDLSWKPEIDIEKGVSILLDKIDYWKDAPVWEPDSIKEQTKDWFKYLSK